MNSDRLLAAQLQQALQQHAAQPALVGDGLALSAGEVLARAQALGTALRAHGVAADEPLQVRCANHPLDFMAFLGTWLADAVAVPVHRSTPPGVLDAIQAKARCRWSIDPVAPGFGIEPLPTVPDDDPARRRLLHGAALVIFTSGSTGSPKGVVLSHAAFAGKLQQNQRAFALGPQTVTLLVLNDTFSFGIWVALLTLLHGGRVLTRSRFEPGDFLRSLAEDGVDFVGVVPTMVRATFGALDAGTLERWRAATAAAGRLRTVVIGGEPLGEALSARLRAHIAPAALYDVYGLTETSTSDFILHPDDYPEHPASIGRAAVGVRWRIRDGQGAEAAPGVPGELQLRTPYVMAGYLGDAAQTAAAFDDGWLRTGDLASHDGAGFVSIVGRLKELIVRGGNKITPAEVERALARCPGVGQAMAVGVPDAVLGQRIVALLIPAPGAVLDAAALRAALAPQLERYKQPDRCVVGSALPTGRTGKADRGRLAALLAEGALADLPGWARP